MALFWAGREEMGRVVMRMVGGGARSRKAFWGVVRCARELSTTQFPCGPQGEGPSLGGWHEAKQELPHSRRPPGLWTEPVLAGLSATICSERCIFSLGASH